MFSRLLDSRYAKLAARGIEAKHNRLLGTKTTMTLARAVNHVRNRRCCDFRQSLHRTALGQLFAENGPEDRSGLHLCDGWAVDTSQSLPHLQQLLTDAQVIIKERGGVNRGGGERAFFQQILTDEYILRFPSILDFAASNQVLRPIIEYMGLLPALSVSFPLGVRLNESDARFTPRDAGGYSQSQLFHRDYHDSPMVYVIVALRDVTIQSGPFCILPASASLRASKALRYGAMGSPYRITDEQMYKLVERKELFEFSCPAGSVLFVDSSACFHYGSRDAVIPRYLMMYAYVTVCRSDFGDLLRRESDTPVLDDSARTRRARYPLSLRDSKLRRLVLDRQALWEA